MNEAYFVIGMHRSGTSLVANILDAMGVDMWKSTRKPDKWNPQGYGEDSDFNRINRAILQYCGGWWAKPPENIEECALLFLPELRGLISRREGKWGLKDPRLCLLAKYYPVRPKCIFVQRSKQGIIDSLMRREQEKERFIQDREYWSALIDRYIQSAIQYMSDKDCLTIQYEDLVNWRRREWVIEKLANFCGVEITRKAVDLVKMKFDVTAIMVNFKTPELIKTAYGSFRREYKKLPFILIDNHSGDSSTGWCREQESEYTKVLTLDKNIGHGPALHEGMLLADTPYVLTLDSDTITMKPGFIRAMVNLFQYSERLYATGWLRWVNLDGVAASGIFDKNKFTPYIHPYCAIFDREKYFQLDPFINHGAPLVYNMRSAKKKGFAVKSFPVESYVKHLIAGTRRMWKGHWYAGEKPIQEQWTKDRSYPI